MGGQQGAGGEDLLGLGPDGACIGLENQVIGDGRRLALDLKIPGQDGDISC